MSEIAHTQARRAALLAAVAGLGALVPVAAWLGYLVWRVLGATFPDASTTFWTAALDVPILGRLEIPPILGVALLLPGPVVVTAAAVAALRWMRRAPRRVPTALALGAAGGVLATLPGLVVGFTWHYVYGQSATSGGSGGSGLGPAPLCGPVYLGVAALFGWAWVAHAQSWRSAGSGEADGTAGLG